MEFDSSIQPLKQCYTGPGDLLPTEVFWRENFKWLSACGYRLRSRYSPDWVPSWMGTSDWWYTCEDGQTPSWSTVMDARRSSDDSLVMLKVVRTSQYPREVEIARWFSLDASVSADPRNHCVPIYDVLDVPDTRDLVLVVMPYLLEIQCPFFETVGEGMEYARQVFEGVQFLHSHGVAHRAIKPRHILMDASHLYSEPFHPVYPMYTRDLNRDSKPYSRTERPVKYYLIDFGLAVQYPPMDLKVVREDYPPWDGERTVPEYWLDSPCDPFAGDVYCLGILIRELFTEGNGRGFDFLIPLVRDMINAEPAHRPRIDEVVLRFSAIASALTPLKCRSRLADRQENAIAGLFRSMFHWSIQCRLIWQGVSPVPKI